MEARLTECPEALVALSAQLVLRYLSCTSVEKAEMESLTRVCLTLVSKLTERMYVPLSDAYAFQQDLQQCVAVKEVAGSGHSPHLDNPDVVVNHLKEFILS